MGGDGYSTTPTAATARSNSTATFTARTNSTAATFQSLNSSTSSHHPEVRVEPRLPPREKAVELKSPERHYIGEVCQGVEHGKGRCQYPTGNTYDGEWKDGKKHGQGLFIFGKDGSSYDGCWHSDRMHGEGVYRYVDRSIYKGTFHQDKCQGYGSLTYANGDVYEGEWFEGQMHGRGIFTQGQSRREVRYDHGVFRVE